MRARSVTYRRLVDFSVRVISVAAALISIAFLVWILLEVVVRGASALNIDLITKRTGPFNLSGAGLANAILGTLYLVAFAVIVGVPVGLFAGVYLSELGRDNPFSTAIRFISNTLIGMPSILIGVFVYALMVVPMRHYSGLAGGVALIIIMLPVIARTTEDMLRLVPNELRESAMALGAPRWRVTMGVVFRAAAAGLVTGVLLAVARVSGETAPLLYTAFNNSHFTWLSDSGIGRYIYDLREPTANLTVTIFKYAMSPYEEWKRQAWGGSLLITGGILLLSVVARAVFQRGSHERSKRK